MLEIGQSNALVMFTAGHEAYCSCRVDARWEAVEQWWWWRRVVWRIVVSLDKVEWVLDGMVEVGGGRGVVVR